MTVSDRTQPLSHLNIFAVRDAELHNLSCEQRRPAQLPSRILCHPAPVSTAESGTFTAFGTALPLIEILAGVPALYLPSRLSNRSQTSTVVLPGSSAGLIRDTFAGDRSVDARNRNRSSVANFQPLRYSLREMNFRKQRRRIHHRDERAAGARGFTRKEWAIGDNPGDRAAYL